MVDRARSRLFRAELSLGEDGRTLTGYAVPFDVQTEVDDGDGPYLESFQRGAFRNVTRAPHMVPLRYEHDDDINAWVGKGKLLRETPQGLWSEWRIDDPKDEGITRARQEHLSTLLYKVRDGQLPALSVSFYAGRTDERLDGNRVHRVRQTVKRIDHVALVPEGAYPMLEPLAVRHASVPAQSSVQRWREWRNGLTLNP